MNAPSGYRLSSTSVEDTCLQSNPVTDCSSNASTSETLAESDDIADLRTVCIGGQAPMFLPDDIADHGFVRMGGQSPIF